MVQTGSSLPWLTAIFFLLTFTLFTTILGYSLFFCIQLFRGTGKPDSSFHVRLTRHAGNAAFIYYFLGFIFFIAFFFVWFMNTINQISMALLIIPTVFLFISALLSFITSKLVGRSLSPSLGAINAIICAFMAVVAFFVLIVTIDQLLYLQGRPLQVILTSGTKPPNILEYLFFNNPRAGTSFLLALHTICLGGIATAFLTQFWLIARRDADDYGRDYYAYALKACSNFALWFIVPYLILTACLIWEHAEINLVFMRLASFTEFKPMAGLFAIILPFIAVFPWSLSAASDSPMRYKVSLLCMPLLFLIGTFYCYLTIFPKGYLPPILQQLFS